jgi:hypothetical protein
MGAADLDAAAGAATSLRILHAAPLRGCRAGMLNADLAGRDSYILPTVRTDAILSRLIARDDHEEPTIEQSQEPEESHSQRKETSSRRDDQPLGYSPGLCGMTLGPARRHGARFFRSAELA